MLEELAPDNAKAYHDSIMKAYFSDNRDISNPDILTQLAVDVGVDADAFTQAMATRGEAMTELAYEEYKSATSQDIHSIPTVVFEHQFPVAGAQPLSTYENVVEQIEAQLAAQGE